LLILNYALFGFGEIIAGNTDINAVAAGPNRLACFGQTGLVK
jgi:hypothetical protein